MSTPIQIEARRTVVALVRAKITDDHAAGAALVAGESAEDAAELMAALEGWAAALTATTGSSENPPVFDHSSPAADAAIFDALLDYIVRHLTRAAAAAGKTPDAVLDGLALAALEFEDEDTDDPDTAA